MTEKIAAHLETGNETVGDYLTAAWLKMTDQEPKIAVADAQLLRAYCGFLMMLNQREETAAWAADCICTTLDRLE